LLLCLTTNAQFLDEEKFFEIKDITETLYISIDCHIPEVLETRFQSRAFIASRISSSQFN